jgi:hypothetical protein
MERGPMGEGGHKKTPVAGGFGIPRTLNQFLSYEAEIWVSE